MLRVQCYRFIKKQGPVTLEQICDLVKASSVSKVELSSDDIQCLLNTLVFDGLVDEVDAAAVGAGAGGGGASGLYYRGAALEVPAVSSFTAIPCGVCPVLNECHDQGVISPGTCTYFAQWLTW